MIFIISEKGEQINEVEKLEILAHIGRRTSYLLGRNKHCEPLRSIVTRYFRAVKARIRVWFEWT